MTGSGLRPFDAAPKLAIPRLAAIAFLVLLLHFIVNGNYGFHRDELATLDDARFLAWGYDAYPPLTPFFGRLSLELFGISVWGARLFPAVAQAFVIVLGGLIARELGGARFAQSAAALAVAISPVSLASGSLLQYVTFDFLWWVLVFWLVLKLENSRNPRWWLAIGVALGLGMMTKYTMGVLAVSMVSAMLLTPARRWLRTRWFWFGVAVSILVWMPNVLWQAQHHFVSAEFLSDIHARDVRIGRTSGFLLEQLFVAANLFSLPFWIAGLVWLLFRTEGRRWRIVGWMAVFSFLLFVAAKGRSYYVAPVYPVLLAAGCVWLERFTEVRRRSLRSAAVAALAIGGILIVPIATPLAPVGSGLWNFASRVNEDFREELGWPELVGKVAAIRDTLPPVDRKHLGVLAANYGEAGAIDLLGGPYHLPPAISGINSYWERGYGDPPPQILIVLGLSPHSRARNFENCELAAQLPNPLGIDNEEWREHREIYVCRGLRQPWPEFWKKFRYFG